MFDSVSAVLTICNREYSFQDQIECLLNQSVKIEEILVWCFKKEHLDLISETNKKYNLNLKFGYCGYPTVWSRFSFALNTYSDYIILLDDDIFPGKKYIERCLNEYKKEPSIIVASGIKFSSNNPQGFYSYVRYGWDKYPQNLDTMEVHYGGHSWFAHRKVFSTFWNEYNKKYPEFAGEDMHISHMAKKYLNMKTKVLSHDANDLDGISNHPESKGYLYGHDKNGLSYSLGISKIQEVFKYKLEENWFN